MPGSQGGELSSVVCAALGQKSSAVNYASEILPAVSGMYNPAITG